MRKRVLQLGLGMQGKACLYDLVRSDVFDEITVLDSLPKALTFIEKLGSSKVRPIIADAADTSRIAELMTNADVVIDLLPQAFTFEVAKIAVEKGVNHVTASYLINVNEPDPVKRQERLEELEKLNNMAKEKGIFILSEFGMDPGIDLILSKKAIDELDEVLVFFSYGAGFPDKDSGNNAIKYKFTWSISGVMGSYLRPARIMLEGRVVDIKAEEMFAQENMHILTLPELGMPLECFANGDSLHYTKLMGIENSVRSIGRFICRWPGHGAFWYVMAKAGLLSNEPLDVKGVRISPKEFLATFFASKEEYKYRENERDVALIRIDAKGHKNGEKRKIVYQLIDKRDLETGFTAMQRTVGFTISIGVQMIANGILSSPGILYPMDVPFDYFMKELEKRGMKISYTEEQWSGGMYPWN